MPRYDYRCEDDACETDTFEVSKSYSDDSVTGCPSCGSMAKKLLSPIAIHFKGSGFYVTDNRASNGASNGDSDKPDSKAGEKSESKTEAKSDAGSGSKAKSESGSSSKTESKTEASSKSSDSKSGSPKKSTGVASSKT